MNKRKMSLMTFPMGWDVLYQNMTVYDTLWVAQQAGIPYIDILHATDDQIEAYRAAVRDTGVQVYVYIASVPFLGSEQERNDAIRQALTTAASLDAKYLMIIPYSPLDAAKAAAMGREAVKQHMIQGFRSALELSKAYGIRICFETTPHDSSCLSGTQDCLDVLNAVPGLDFVFDTANMLPHGDDPMEAYEALKDRISYVHLKDVRLVASKDPSPYAEYASDGRLMQCVVWGEGIIPVKALYERMIADGYTGCFAIEYVHPGGACGPAQHQHQLARFFEER